MHGLGNDFIIFDNIDNPIIYEVNFIKKISNRRIGIGCDQILMIANTNVKENEFVQRNVLVFCKCFNSSFFI